MNKSYRKYIIVFFITIGIFVVAYYASVFFAERRLNKLREIQEKVAVDLLTSETQYSLTTEVNCTESSSPLLTNELASLADKLSYAEDSVSPTEFLLLKEQYTILEVKDFLLTKRIGERCGNPPAVILYFYGKKNDCPECVKQSYVLDAIREKYKGVRVYSFDNSLNLSTVKTLKTIYSIDDKLPALVIDGKTVTGFVSVENVIKLLPTSITNPSPEQEILNKSLLEDQQ